MTRRKKEKERCADAASTETLLRKEGVHYFDLVLVSSIGMGVYLSTLYPSIAGGDSGELVAESCHLGVSHPPGYPLFNMIVHWVTRLPFQATKAWKSNAFSAACDTLCSVFIYLSIILWTGKSRSSAITAALLFAFSPLIWTYAIGAEVFALNNLFSGALIYILLLYAQSNEWKYACLGAFVSGLALCNQHTIVLFEIPIILWVLSIERHRLTTSRFATLACCFLLGLLPYIYMPIASYYNPQPGSWGHVTTLSGFFHHVRRGDYGTFRLYSSNADTEGLQTRLALYVQDVVVKEGVYLIAPCALYGIYSMLSNKVGRIVVGTFLFYVIVFHSLANLPLTEGLLYGVHMRFWQQPNVIVFIWMGIGLSAAFDRLHQVIAIGIGISLVVYQIHRSILLCDQSEGWYISNYAKALIDPLPVGSLFFTNYDLQWTALRYLQRCEGFRTDVILINLSMMTYQWFQHKHEHYPQLMFPGSHLVPSGSTSGGFSMKQLIDANYKTFKKTGIYIGGKLSYHDKDFDKKYFSVPFGLLNRFARKSPSLDQFYFSNKKAMEHVHQYLPQLPPSEKYDESTWEWTIARDYHMHRAEQATYLLEKIVAKNNQSLSLLMEVARPLEYTLMNEPKEFYADHLLKNLGLAYAHMVRSAESFDTLEAFESHVGASVADPTNYKDRASARMLEVWRQWLHTPTAVNDQPSYGTIKGIVDQFPS